MRLRIAILSNAYKPTISGVVTSMSRFRQGLIARGHDVHVFAPEVEGYEDQEPYVFRFPSFLDLTQSYEVSLCLPLKRPMRQTIAGIKPHLIHSQHPVLVGELAATYAHDLKVPLVFTFHTRYDEYLARNVPVLSEWAGQIAREVVQDYLNRCTHVIAPTASIERMIYEDYEIEAPVTVLPTPIDLGQYAHPDPEPIRRKYRLYGKQVLLYLGRISQEKSIDMLLQAFTRLVVQRPQTVLMIAGRGPHSDTLQELARSLGIEGQVIFAGAVPYDQVPHYMAAADLFVFASTAETQGLVVLEALAAGTPVVAVHASGIDDVLAGSEGGVLVQDDEATFADTILSILSRPDRIAEMRRAARETAQRYTISAATERLLAVYDRAMASGPRYTERSLFGIPRSNHSAGRR
jgi:1,2-diacylglycerol 3-alpha-glucosyltransferase